MFSAQKSEYVAILSRFLLLIGLLLLLLLLLDLLLSDVGAKLRFLKVNHVRIAFLLICFAHLWLVKVARFSAYLLSYQLIFIYLKNELKVNLLI